MRRGRGYPSVDSWAVVAIEGYCLLNVDYGAQKDRYVFQLKPDGSRGRVRNQQYDPAAHPDPYPDGCVRRVGSRCIGCPHFGWCDADENLV